MDSPTRHPRFQLFLLYCSSFVSLGLVITALGPMFPYFSETEGRLQTEYSFLFMCRALGYFSGSALVKVAEKFFSFNKNLCLATTTAGVFLLLFSFTSDLNLRGFFIYGASIGCAFMDVFVNVAAIECFKDGNRLATWLQVLHGAFGIGGLLGPFIVYLFELYAMVVIGILMLILAPIFWLTPSPELKSQEPLETKILEAEISNPVAKQKSISQMSNYLLAMMFYFVVGQECTFGGWISSYSVLEGFSTKEHATVYSSAYWISITFFRLVLAFVHGKASKKVTILLTVAVIQTFISLGTIFHVNSQLGLILSCIVFGLSNSVLFPLLLVVPEQFGLVVSAGQNSNFMLLASLGEGTLSVVVGYLMKFFSYNWFFYSMGLMNLGALLMFGWVLKTLALEKDVNEKERQGIQLVALERAKNTQQNVNEDTKSPE